MAVTKTKPIRSTVKKAIDYICNPDKTDGSILVSSYMCSPETADLEWEFTRSKARAGGCQLARHLIQSFAPSEVDFDTAHEIGKRLADMVLGDKYEYVLSTHIDRGHVHNHLIFNTVSFKDFHRYQSNKSSYYFIRRCSDMLCREYGLSIIEPTENKGKSYIEYTADKKGMSWKTKLRRSINTQILYAHDFDDFLKRMEQENYQIKRGKYLSFCAEGQQRFIRSRTLGDDYAENALIERIAGTYKPKTVSLLIDIQNNIKCQQHKGYEQWAKVHNIKIIAQTLIYLQDNKLLKYNDLCAKMKSVNADFFTRKNEIKDVESRINEINFIIENIDNYLTSKPVVDKLQNVFFKDKYRRENESAFILYESSKKKLNPYLSDNKLPNVKNLKAELGRLYPKKSKLYEKYENIKSEQKQIITIKQNIDTWLKPAPIRSLNRDYGAR